MNVNAARKWIRNASAAKIIKNAIDYLMIIEFENGEAAIWIEDEQDNEMQIEDWVEEFDQTFGE